MRRQLRSHIKKIFLHPARILYDILFKKILGAYFEVLGYNSTMKH